MNSLKKLEKLAIEIDTYCNMKNFKKVTEHYQGQEIITYYGNNGKDVYGGNIPDSISISCCFDEDELYCGSISVDVNGYTYHCNFSKDNDLDLSSFRRTLYIDGMYYCLNTLVNSCREVKFSSFKRAIKRFYSRNV